MTDGGDNNLAWPLKIIGFDFVAYDNLGHNQISTPTSSNNYEKKD